MSPAKSRHIALILLEGDTEEEFYKKLAQRNLVGQRRKFANMEGNFNINTKIVDAAKTFSKNNPNDKFDIYLCIDQERTGFPAYNHKLVYPELQKFNNFKSLFPVIAILMIESLFFIDIDGIYRFLRAKRSLRNHKKFANFRALTDKELSHLFKQFKHVYIKGIKCEHFVDSLDINKIILNAQELSRMVDSIKKRS